jgi:hypothetical protein
MGIDAEDGGPGGHGPVSVYSDVVASMLGNVSNGNTGILVIGGSVGSNVRTFWDAISADVGRPVSFVTGASAIASQSFGGSALVAVSSSEQETGGGLTDAESEALKLRSFDLAVFVNNGGGLLSFSQTGLTTPYGFLGDIGTFASAPADYSAIEPTAAGTAAGITTALNVCCWHDVFTAFPSFLQPLAFEAGTTNVAALGGASVVIPTGIVLDPATQTVNQGGECAVTATVTENDEPVSGAVVNFTVVDGPNAPQGGSGSTNASGKATFSYAGDNLGTDEIGAEYTDSLGRVRIADVVTCTVVAPTGPTTPTTGGPAASGGTVTPRFTG